MKSKKLYWVLIAVLLILFGFLYLNKKLKEIDACASRVDERTCFEEYYENNSWVERWFNINF